MNEETCEGSLLNDQSHDDRTVEEKTYCLLLHDDRYYLDLCQKARESSGANLPDVADVQKGPRAQALPAQISDAVSMPDSSSGFQLINKHNFCDDQPA